MANAIGFVHGGSLLAVKQTTVLESFDHVVVGRRAADHTCAVKQEEFWWAHPAHTEAAPTLNQPYILRAA